MGQILVVIVMDCPRWNEQDLVLLNGHWAAKKEYKEIIGV